MAYFSVAIALGALLRGMHVFDAGVNYRYMVHTHSHIALLGWAYLGLTVLLSRVFLKEEKAFAGYKRVFRVTHIPLLGMLFTFPFQGYALYSIVFSTLFLLVSYWFAWVFLKHVPSAFKGNTSFRFVRAALFYMVLSSLGPWALGGIMTILGPESVWYRIAIYFYLHFQYNAWMVLALIGLLFYLMERKGIAPDKRVSDRIFYGFNAGVVLSFFLSVLWAAPWPVFYLAGGLGALSQVCAFGLLLRVLLMARGKGRGKPDTILIRLFLVLSGVKFLLQLLTAFPYFAELAASVIHFVIGYLHWTFLGVVSVGIFWAAKEFRLLYFPNWFLPGYLFCFVITELLIFYKGIQMWMITGSSFDADVLLWVSSTLFLLPVGAVLILNAKRNLSVESLSE